MSSAQVLKPVRRIVTGHTAKGRSTIVNDGPTPNVFVSTDVEGFGAIVPWQTEPGDLSNDDNNDPAPAEAEVPMSPKLGGTVFRIASFPPDESYSDAAADSLFGDIGEITPVMPRRTPRATATSGSTGPTAWTTRSSSRARSGC